jgi:hypothetical protein
VSAGSIGHEAKARGLYSDYTTRSPPSRSVDVNPVGCAGSGTATSVDRKSQAAAYGQLYYETIVHRENKRTALEARCDQTANAGSATYEQLYETLGQRGKRCQYPEGCDKSARENARTALETRGNPTTANGGSATYEQLHEMIVQRENERMALEAGCDLSTAMRVLNSDNDG